MDNRPIGIFDSGLGGLTAVRALERLLPGEDLIYFGDSANAPYGTRPLEELRSLARANADVLQSRGVKAILVACGTVSSNAMDALRAHAAVPCYGVLEAPCAAAAALAPAGRIAVAATEATVRSGAFQRCLTAQPGGERLTVLAKACQSLVRTAELGHFRPDDREAQHVVTAEFGPIRDFEPEVLLLACTHFPLFEEGIAEFMGPQVRLLSVSDASAEALRESLEAAGALAGRRQGTTRFYTSGPTADFDRLAALFLGRSVASEQVEREM